METLKKLQAVLDIKKGELRKIRDKIDAIKREVELPKAKKKYEGKYFKYIDNSYGFGEGKWDVFYYIKEMEDETYYKGVSCQIDCDGIPEIKGASGFIASLHAEITKEEYEKQFNKALKKLQ